MKILNFKLHPLLLIRNLVFFLICVSANIDACFAVPTIDLDEAEEARNVKNEFLKCLASVNHSFSVSSPSIALGGSVNLNWSVSMPEGCSLELTLNSKPVELTGSRDLKPLSTTTYRLSTQFMGEMYTFGLKTVTVNLPSTVYISGNTNEWKWLLKQALGEGGKKVVLTNNLQMDLTGFDTIFIAENTYFTSELPSLSAQINSSQFISLKNKPSLNPLGRNTDNLGPRIFVTDKRISATPLFIIKSSNVRVSGFRLQGPNPGIGAGNNNKEYAIEIFPEEVDKNPSVLSDPISQQLHGIEISNMEFYFWSGAAIDINDNSALYKQGRMTFSSASGVHIHDNYFHHNRHYDGFGYGVNVGSGGYALITENVFEENRHAIAGNSKSKSGLDFSGYIARNNLILPGGGLHCTEGFFNTCWQTHQIDMHGDQSMVGGFYQHCCGTAGETMIIEQNTVLYTGGRRLVKAYVSGKLTESIIWEDGYAMKIRGNPKDKVYVNANVFAHNNRTDAISQNGDQPELFITRPISVTPHNLWGAKPLNDLVKCDFTGDGLPDDFMATGVTWWVKSAVTGQWKFLNAKYEKPDQLIVQDFDGDNICDVVLKPKNPLNMPYIYAKSGVGNWINRTKTVVNF